MSASAKPQPFRFASPKGRMDPDALGEQSRRERVERESLVRLPRLAFLDPARRFKWERVR